MDHLRGAVPGDGGLEHLDGEVVRLAFLDPPADDLPGVDIHDGVDLENRSLPLGIDVGDVPGPDLAGAGGLENGLLSGAAFAAAFGRDCGACVLVLVLCRDPPPGAAGGDHYPVVPGRGEGMIHGVVLLPAGQDELKNPVLMDGADPAFIGPVPLVDGVLDAWAGIEPVVPGPTRYTRKFQGRPLGTGDLFQLQDESVLSGYERF